MKHHSRITLAHGNGGVAMRELIELGLRPILDNPLLDTSRDAAEIHCGARMLITTDSYTVQPLTFPGGDIGKLAACGTLNDLAVSGARPEFLTLSVLVDEGFEIELLVHYARSLANVLASHDCRLVCGDTKVLPLRPGHTPGLILNTTGLGRPLRDNLSLSNIQSGDLIIVSGPIGDHGIAVLLAREEFGLSGDIVSDCACVWPQAERLLGLHYLRFMRDPTRGGVATVCHEIIASTKFGITLYENSIPVRPSVRSACELLGYDPLYLACEGRIVAVVSPEQVTSALQCLGAESAMIGTVEQRYPELVLHTRLGGERLLEPLLDDPLPRIC